MGHQVVDQSVFFNNWLITVSDLLKFDIAGAARIRFLYILNVFDQLPEFWVVHHETLVLGSFCEYISIRVRNHWQLLVPFYFAHIPFFPIHHVSQLLCD